jgi:Chaperone of endosialidase
MKTTLILSTIITSLFFSACANNNRAEDWNARRAANASFQAERLTRLQMDLILNPFTLKFVPANPDVFQGVSSARFKKDIKPMDKTSETVLALKPVTFHYKSDTKGTPQFGLIAEEVAAVNPDLVVRDADGKVYSVRYEAVNAMLLNEFLKEHRKVQELQKQIDALTAGLQKVASDQPPPMKGK